MELQQLQLFCAVVQQGSFAAVARQQQLDPSYVSRVIGQLEDELGFRLFQRTTRHLALTESGQHYWQRVLPLCNELEHARDAALALTQQPQGLLRITASVAFGYTCLLPLIKGFRQQYPHINIELQLTDRVLDLVADGLDLAIRLSPSSDSSLVCTRLRPTPYHICASPAYLQQHGTPQHPNELANHDCIVFPLTGYRSHWHFRHANHTLTVGIQSSLIISNALAILRATQEGLGISLLADWLVDTAIAQGELIQLLPEYDVSATDFANAAWLLYPSKHYLPSKVRVFIDYLKQHM